MNLLMQILLAMLLSFTLLGCGGADETGNTQTPSTNPASGEPPATESNTPHADRLSIPGMSYVKPEGWYIGPEGAYHELRLIEPNRIFAIDVYYGGQDTESYDSYRESLISTYTLFEDIAEIVEEQELLVDGNEAKLTIVVRTNPDRFNTAVASVWVPPIADGPDARSSWQFTLETTNEDIETLRPALLAVVESVEFDGTPE